MSGDWWQRKHPGAGSCKRIRDKEGEITVKCGCFLGKIDRFLEKVTSTHANTKYALVYRAAVEVARLQIIVTDEVLETDEH